MKLGFLAFGLALFAVACSPPSHEPEHKLVGKNPVIPAPDKSAIPTLNFSSAKGWPAGVTPTVTGTRLFGLRSNLLAYGSSTPSA